MNPHDEVERLHASIPDEVRRLASLGPAIAVAKSTAFLFQVRRSVERAVEEEMDWDDRETLDRLRLAVDNRLHELDREVRRQWEAPDA